MGEIAEMMLDGFMDEETREIIDGEAPGYPRRMSEMQRSAQPNRSKPTKKTIQCNGCPRWFATLAALGQHLASPRLACTATPDGVAFADA